ncbi:MAG: hypothetical protein ABI894_02210 [Ilumatobacteraceae bacterium]
MHNGKGGMIGVIARMGRWIMFAQVIEGKVSDKAGLRRQMDKWAAELRPGATGFLGSTSGVTDDGIGFAIARFESAAAAKANSQRAEQGQWWSETEKCYDGTVSFSDSDDVEEFLGGGSNDAGFVQVMKIADGPDRATVTNLDQQFEKHAKTWRPDLIGGVRVWTGTTSTVEVNYFRSEEDARRNESKEPPPELAELFAQYADVMAKTEFLDLRDPWLV